MVPFLRAVHGGEPRVMREDFCGSGGVCREWAKQKAADKPFRAIGVDLDPEPLKRLRRVKNVEAVCADVMDCDAAADIISATNFPVGYWHARPDLVRYLKATRRRLKPGGVFVCDTYGGTNAFITGSTVRDFWIDGGIRIRYTWEQRQADLLTGMVTDVVHFRGFKDRDVVLDQPEAFVYRWRLWSIQELRDAMEEAGFSAVEVYAELADAKDERGRVYVRPVTSGEELGDNWVVCIVARA
jgi:SAM-dependent methyltransferase